jgi:hypothetical protein
MADPLSADSLLERARTLAGNHDTVMLNTNTLITRRLHFPGTPLPSSIHAIGRHTYREVSAFDASREDEEEEEEELTAAGGREAVVDVFKLRLNTNTLITRRLHFPGTPLPSSIHAIGRHTYRDGTLPLVGARPW